MRIHRRTEFLKLPSGTIYRKIAEPWVIGELSIKGDTVAYDGKDIDWYADDLGWVAASDSGEFFGKLDEMLNHGASHPLERIDCRDGCFEDEALFLVYELADLELIREAVDEAIAACSAPSGESQSPALPAGQLATSHPVNHENLHVQAAALTIGSQARPASNPNNIIYHFNPTTRQWERQ